MAPGGRFWTQKEVACGRSPLSAVERLWKDASWLSQRRLWVAAGGWRKEECLIDMHAAAWDTLAGLAESMGRTVVRAPLRTSARMCSGSFFCMGSERGEGAGGRALEPGTRRPSQGDRRVWKLCAVCCCCVIKQHICG